MGRKKPSYTAIHEVGHALVAFILGCRIGEIVKKNDTDGYCLIYHPKNEFGVKDKVIMSCVMIAGHLAEVVFCGNDIRCVPESDYKRLFKIGTSIKGANILNHDLMKFLKGNKNTVFHLARLLDERGRIGRNTFLKELRVLGW